MIKQHHDTVVVTTIIIYTPTDTALEVQCRNVALQGNVV